MQLRSRTFEKSALKKSVLKKSVLKKRKSATKKRKFQGGSGVKDIDETKKRHAECIEYLSKHPETKQMIIHGHLSMERLRHLKPELHDLWLDYYDNEFPCFALKNILDETNNKKRRIMHEDKKDIKKHRPTQKTTTFVPANSILATSVPKTLSSIRISTKNKLKRRNDDSAESQDGSEDSFEGTDRTSIHGSKRSRHL